MAYEITRILQVRSILLRFNHCFILTWKFMKTLHELIEDLDEARKPFRGIRERIYLFIGWLIAPFVSHWNEFEYGKNPIKCNVSHLELFEITEKWDDHKVESITVIHHDKVEKNFPPYTWRLHGDAILRNCRKIKVRVNYKPQSI